MRQYWPVILLVAVAVVVFGAFVVLNIADQETNTAPEATGEVSEIAEAADDAEGTTEVEATEQREATATEAPAEATPEATEETQSAAPSPTSRSRVTQSILIGTQTTPVLRPTTSDAASDTDDTQPTPTSMSRVTQSILISTEAQTSAPANTETGTDEATPQLEDTETPEGTPEATPETTDEAAIGGIGSLPPSVNQPSILQPQGPVAQRQSFLWWLMFGLGTVIYLAVVGLVLTLVYRHWRGNEMQLSDRGTSLLIAGGGIGLPIVVLSVLFALTLHTMVTLASSNNPSTLTIEVTGNQWWWEVSYPEYDLVTANEIHIPAGEPVRFELTSADVIHSFWVPQLAGKMDLFPGRTNIFWFQADEPGEYRGQCAEYCGIQHANMAFLVIAHEPEEFEAWVNQEQQPADKPTSELAIRGQAFFLSSTCAGCHTIQGTSAAGQQGPDLTHVGSRLMIGAGTLTNTEEHLAEWINNSQQFKPGNLMPEQDLSQQNLEAVVAYLQSLQ